MHVVATVLKVLGYMWLVAGVLFVGACLIAVCVQKGFSEVLSILSPFNVLNWIVTMIALAPGLVALWLSGKTENKLVSAKQSDTEE